MAWYVVILNVYSGSEQPIGCLRAQGMQVPTHYSFLGADDVMYEGSKDEFEKHGMHVVASKKGIPSNKVGDFSTLCSRIVKDLNKGKKVSAQEELDAIVTQT
jgi:hypothetical protein